MLAGGDIIVVQEEAADGLHIEIMGSIDTGITAARWSPDEELLVITTKADTVVFMSRSFDGIAEATMIPADLSASKHVSVGWGKKETQFQGKGAKAKALRDPTIPEKVDEGKLSSDDDGATTISWRGDGAYVAISAVESATRRLIRVYTRDGVLDGVSEPVDGLEGALSWRPAGNLIAGVQRLSDRVDVVFFERNGLRHGQFTLRSTESLLEPGTRIRLEWNTDSTVLAVSFGSSVQLWTMGNHHWYLKQELSLRSPCSHVSWHPEKALRLSVVSAGKTPTSQAVDNLIDNAADTVLHTEFIFAVARGSLLPPHDFGAVAVVDGTTLKITPFRTANVPPPMSMYDIEAGHTIIDVAFAQDNSTMAVLHHGGVDLYEWQTRNGRSLKPQLIAQHFAQGHPSFSKGALQICLASPHEPHVLCLDQGLKVCRFNLDVQSKVLSDSVDIAVDEDILFTQANSTTNIEQPESKQDLLVATRSGNLLRLDNNSSFQPVTAEFPVQLPWVEVVDIEGETVAFGLSRGGHLYANSRQLVKNCTSFLVTCDHLILTTSNHFLKFVHLKHPEGQPSPPLCRSVRFADTHRTRSGTG